MNDLHASYLPRHAADLLRRALEVSPVAVLMGARQTGKTTLARSGLDAAAAVGSVAG